MRKVYLLINSAATSLGGVSESNSKYDNQKEKYLVLIFLVTRGIISIRRMTASLFSFPHSPQGIHIWF